MVSALCSLCPLYLPPDPIARIQEKAERMIHRLTRNETLHLNGAGAPLHDVPGALPTTIATAADPVALSMAVTLTGAVGANRDLAKACTSVPTGSERCCWRCSRTFFSSATR